MNFNLINHNTNIERGDMSSLESYVFENGRKLPKSYVDFVEQYGYGLSCGLFIIYIPMDKYPDSLFVRSKGIIGTYQDVLDDEEKLWFDIKPDLSYKQLKDLIPFSMSENGHYLFWDINSQKETNEFDIYISDFRGIGFVKVAKNLYDFFRDVTSESNFKKVLPFTSSPLTNTFIPYRKIEQTNSNKTP